MRLSRKGKPGHESNESVLKSCTEEFTKLPIHASKILINWAANLAIYNGKHDLAENHESVNEYIDSNLWPDIETEHQSKINIITANTDISVAKLLKEQPTPQSIPAGSDATDKQAASVANFILNNAFGQSDLDLTQKSYEVLTIAKVMSTGFWKMGWDPDAEDGKGDYTVEVLDGFQVFPDPTSTNYFNMRYCYHAYLSNIDYIKEVYPSVEDIIQPYNAKDENKYMYLTDKMNLKLENRVLVLEKWERPSKRFPKGRKIIILNNQHVVENTENPFAGFGKYAMPFVPFYWKKSHDDILGINTFNDVVNIQMEINELASLIMDNASKMGNVFWFLPIGAGVKKEDLDARPGGIVEYNPAGGGVPVQGAPAALPSHLANHLSMLMGAAQDIDGIHEVSKGMLPERGSQMSGSALKLLIDSEQVRHSPAMRLLKSSLKIASFILLLMAQNFMNEKRIVSVTGKGKGYEVKTFKADVDLKGDFDVVISIGSAFTTSPAAKVEAMFNLWDRGILSAAVQGDKAAQMVLGALEYGDIDINKLEELNKSKAIMVVKRISEGGEVPPFSTLDDHEIHIKVLNEYRLSAEYEELSADKKMAFEARIDEHEKTKMEREMHLAQTQGMRMGNQQPPNQQPSPQMGPMDAGAAMTEGGEQ